MSSPTIVVFGLLYLELLPFARMKILLLFSAVFCDIEFKVCIRICLGLVQIKFEFWHIWPYFELLPFA